MRFPLPKIYPITDTGLSGLLHTEQTERLIEGGATFIQLREKNTSAGDFFEDARSAVELAHKLGARVIINDRVDIALMTRADGVHLGQNDLPVTEARRLLGQAAIIGLSTHTLEQVKIALKVPEIDYIAFGPIFPTSTKADPDPTVGLEQLRMVRSISGSRPIVAIGGITVATLKDVLKAGADAVALVGGLYRPGHDIATNFNRLAEIAASESVKTA